MARYARGAVLLGLAVVVLAGAAPGEEKKEEVRTVFVPLGGERIVRMKNSGFIKSAANPDQKALYLSASGKRVQLAFERPDPETKELVTYHTLTINGMNDSGHSIHVEGISLGKVRVELEDREGTKEVIEIVVRREIPLSVGVPARLQMTDKKAIKKALTSDEKVARVQVLKDEPVAVRIEPKAVGQTTVTLTDADGRTEIYEVLARSSERSVVVGEKQKIQMTKLKATDKAYWLDAVYADCPQIIRLRGVKDDPTTVEIEGLEVGACEITLQSLPNPAEGLPPIRETIQFGVKPKEK